LLGLLMTLFSCSENKLQLHYVSKKDIETFFDLDFDGAKRKLNNAEVSIFSIIDQMGMYGCNNSIYLLEKLYVPVNVASDTAFIVQNEYLTLFFNSRSSKPYALSISYTGKSAEIAIDKNVLLREKKHGELNFERISSKYYYVNETVAKDVVFKNAKVLFVDSMCVMPYQRVLEKQGYYLLFNSAYKKDVNYLYMVNFKNW